ncbi:hypothetical protein ACVVCG_004921, partial [Escherichia coli]
AEAPPDLPATKSLIVKAFRSLHLFYVKFLLLIPLTQLYVSALPALPPPRVSPVAYTTLRLIIPQAELV